MINCSQTGSISIPLQFHQSRSFFHIVCDESGKCLYINPSLTKKLAPSDTDLSGTDLMDLVGPKQFEAFLSATSKIFNEESSNPIEIILDFYTVDKVPFSTQWEMIAADYTRDSKRCVIMTGIINYSRTDNTDSCDTLLSERLSAYEQSTTGIWRIDISEPVNASIPLNDLIGHFKLHGRLVDCNEAFAKMYKVDDPNLLKNSPIEQLMRLDDPVQLESLSEFVKNGFRITDSVSKEYDSNGNVVYFLNSMIGIVENGMLKRVWGTQQDITQKKKVEEQLLKSELFYRNLIADSLDGILLSDKNGVVTYASPSVEKILGFTPSDIIGQNAFSFIHADDITVAKDAFERELNMDPEVKFINVRLKTRFSGYLTCNVRGHNLLYNPYIRGMVIYFHDDEPRRKAELALRESEQRYRMQATILNNVTDVIVTSDLDLRINSWNSVAENISGIPADEAIGTGFRELLNADYSPHTREEISRIAFEKGQWQGEMTFKARNGSKKKLLLTISVFYDDNGKLGGLIGVGKDITPVP